MSDRARAFELWQRAYELQEAGNLDGAIRLYQASIAECPTAEAHTFLGWTYSNQRRWDEAIAECKRAIACDPAFGNPYNDIGVYRMAGRRGEEAARRQAGQRTTASANPRHFPHINL